MSESAIACDYYRSRKTDCIHLADCKRKRTAVPWNYADGMSMRRVAETAAVHGLHLCSICCPRGMYEHWLAIKQALKAAS